MRHENSKEHIYTASMLRARKPEEKRTSSTWEWNKSHLLLPRTCGSSTTPNNQHTVPQIRNISLETYRVSFGQQKFSQIRSILAGDTSDEGDFSFVSKFRHDCVDVCIKERSSEDREWFGSDVLPKNWKWKLWDLFDDRKNHKRSCVVLRLGNFYVGIEQKGLGWSPLAQTPIY